MHKPSRTSTMDKVFMVKDLYALADHLEENLQFIEDDVELEKLQARIRQITALRRDVTGSMNGDKNYACAFKHAAGVWKAAEEVWLADNDSEAFLRYQEATDIFYWVAEQFLGVDALEQCARCGEESGRPEDQWSSRLNSV